MADNNSQAAELGASLKQFLADGASIEDLKKDALEQGVTEEIWTEALKIAQGAAKSPLSMSMGGALTGAVKNAKSAPSKTDPFANSTASAVDPFANPSTSAGDNMFEKKQTAGAPNPFGGAERPTPPAPVFEAPKVEAPKQEPVAEQPKSEPTPAPEPVVPVAPVVEEKPKPEVVIPKAVVPVEPPVVEKEPEPVVIEEPKEPEVTIESTPEVKIEEAPAEEPAVVIEEEPTELKIETEGAIVMEPEVEAVKEPEIELEPMVDIAAMEDVKPEAPKVNLEPAEPAIVEAETPTMPISAAESEELKAILEAEKAHEEEHEVHDENIENLMQDAHNEHPKKKKKGMPSWLKIMLIILLVITMLGAAAVYVMTQVIGAGKALVEGIESGAIIESIKEACDDAEGCDLVIEEEVVVPAIPTEAIEDIVVPAVRNDIVDDKPVVPTEDPQLTPVSENVVVNPEEGIQIEPEAVVSPNNNASSAGGTTEVKARPRPRPRPRPAASAESVVEEKEEVVIDYFAEARDAKRVSSVNSVATIVKVSRVTQEENTYVMKDIEELEEILVSEGLEIPTEVGNGCYLYGYNTDGSNFFIAARNEVGGADGDIFVDGTGNGLGVAKIVLSGDSLDNCTELPSVPGYTFIVLD